MDSWLLSKRDKNYFRSSFLTSISLVQYAIPRNPNSSFCQTLLLKFWPTSTRLWTHRLKKERSRLNGLETLESKHSTSFRGRISTQRKLILFALGTKQCLSLTSQQGKSGSKRGLTLDRAASIRITMKKERSLRMKREPRCLQREIKTLLASAIYSEASQITSKSTKTYSLFGQQRPQALQSFWAQGPSPIREVW